jgi:hypothetical protein
MKIFHSLPSSVPIPLRYAPPPPTTTTAFLYPVEVNVPEDVIGRQVPLLNRKPIRHKNKTPLFFEIFYNISVFKALHFPIFSSFLLFWNLQLLIGNVRVSAETIPNATPIRPTCTPTIWSLKQYRDELFTHTQQAR